MKIDAIVKVSSQGMSRPYVCQGESGDIFWCKGNHTGLRAVMCEWLCAKIAHAVGLPVPECHIAKLEPSCFRDWLACNGPEHPAIVTEANPFVFASKNVELAKDVINVESDLRGVDCALLAKIYLFDAFIHNTDRTEYNSNLLINHGIHVIDHNNAFDPAFNPYTFAKDHILRPYFASTPIAAVKEFEQKLRDVVTASFLDAAWSEMPTEWTDAGSSVFSPEEVKDTLGGNK